MTTSVDSTFLQTFSQPRARRSAAATGATAASSQPRCGQLRLERAEDLADLQEWLRDLYPNDAEAILHGNVERVLRTTLRLRAGN